MCVKEVVELSAVDVGREQRFAPKDLEAFADVRKPHPRSPDSNLNDARP